MEEAERWAPLGKLTRLWNGVIYLGRQGSTGEPIMGNKEALRKMRMVQRRPPEKRWSHKNVEEMMSVPWKTSQVVSEAGEALEGRIVD